MSFMYRHRKMIIFILILIFGGGIPFIYYSFSNEKKETKEKVVVLNKTKEKKKKVESDNIFKVDIKGEVLRPGLYSLKEGSRVSDVINEAGGLTENGDTTVINLSKKITDEMVIIIYSHEEVLDFKKTKEIEKQMIESCINSSGVVNDSCIDSEESNDSNTISINNASKEELMTLPGIGETKAENVIKYRDEKGWFTSIEELKEVDGFGESIFEKIKEKITL